MTILFVSPLAFALVLSSHAFQPLQTRQRTLHSSLKAQPSENLKFFLTGAKPKVPVYADSAATGVFSGDSAIPEFQPETLDVDSIIPDAVYTSAAENAARTTEAVQQATEELRNGLEAAAQSIDTEALLKSSQDVAQTFREGLQGMQSQFALDSSVLEYSPQTVQKMAQNLRDSFQSLAGDSGGSSDGTNAPLLWEYVNNNLQKVNIPKLEPALKGAVAFPEAAFQEVMKQLGELSTQPNWEAEQYLNVLNKEELKSWYWGAFFTLIALGYLPALQNFRMFGDSSPPQMNELLKEMEEMKAEKESRDRDLEELRTEMKLFLDTVQGGRALEAELAEELQVAKETNAAQAKQIEVLQGENEKLREQIKQLTVAVSELKASLDAMTKPEEAVVSQHSAPAPKKSKVAKKAAEQVSEEATMEAVAPEAAPKASEEKAQEDDNNEKSETKKAPKKSAAAKPKSVEIVNNGVDWSRFTVSTLTRKTAQELIDYLEAKGLPAVDSDGKALKKTELVDAVLGVKA